MDRPFRVELCGIQEKDKNVLKRILAITEGRTRTYELADSSAGEVADIVILNADVPEAKEEWIEKYVGANGVSLYPTILASRNKYESTEYSNTKLPFFPSRILKSLDEVTVTELKYTPEIRIEEPGEEQDDESPQSAYSSSIISDYKTELSSKDIETFIGSRTDIKEQKYKQSALVVDDSRPVRKALDMKLRLMDYDVQHAASGREALWLLKKVRFDFIFLDVVMPGVDGYEVCKKIKRNKSTKNIPVVMLTSKSSPFDKVKGKLAGCDNYLTKPVAHDKFEEVVTGLRL